MKDGIGFIPEELILFTTVGDTNGSLASTEIFI
jgi:hypothetical protein